MIKMLNFQAFVFLTKKKNHEMAYYRLVQAISLRKMVKMNIVDSLTIVMLCINFLSVLESDSEIGTMILLIKEILKVLEAFED